MAQKGNILKRGYFQGTPPQFKFRRFVEDEKPWFLKEDPEKWWERGKLGDIWDSGFVPQPPGRFTPISTATYGNGLKLTEEDIKKIRRMLKGKVKPFDKLLKPTKKKKKKREPTSRFLKDRDIDKLMEKHFAKDNSSDGA
jgi:hypothetical protein